MKYLVVLYMFLLGCSNEQLPPACPIKDIKAEEAAYRQGYSKGCIDLVRAMERGGVVGQNQIDMAAEAVA